MGEELKPVRCGCGGEAKVEWANGYDPFTEKRKPNLWYGVICKKCKIQTKSYYTEAEAITAWNTAMRRAKVDILPNTSEDKGEMPFCPHCGDELEWE